MAGWKFFCQFLLILGIWISTTVAQRSSYGEACDATIKCDSSAWLACRNNTCDCMKPDVMIYENSIGKCASKSGERCKFIFGELDENNPIYEFIDCVDNSRCSPDGFCVCDSKFYEDLDGTCTRAKSYMGTCNSQVKCSAPEELQCIDGHCDCDNSTSTYLPGGENSQCVGLAGESCIKSKCDLGSTCSGGKCVCNDGFYQNHFIQMCVQKLEPLGFCINDAQCMNFRGSQLVCNKNICDCDSRFSRYGTSQRHRRDNWRNGYYDSNSYEGDSVTQCLGLAGSPCLDRLCVPNSYCDFMYKQRSSRDNSGTCTCMSGFTESSKGSCAKGFDEACESEDGCIDGLVCKEKKCLCLYADQHYDPATKSCRSKTDGPCNSSTSCVSNAECKLFSVFPVESGHCSCKSGFIKNSEGGCSAKFGQRCTSASSCDTVAGLVCTNQICQCNVFAKHSEKQRKCLGLVGASCDLYLNKVEPQCVENSKCERVHPRLQGVCTCPTGYNETSLYTCELANEVLKEEQGQDDEQEAATSTSTELPPPPEMSYREEQKTSTYIMTQGRPFGLSVFSEEE